MAENPSPATLKYTHLGMNELICHANKDVFDKSDFSVYEYDFNSFIELCKPFVRFLKDGFCMNQFLHIKFSFKMILYVYII